MIPLKEPRSVGLLKTARQIALVRYSACGNYLFAAGRDATIRRWNVAAAEGAPPEGASAEPKKKNDQAVELTIPELPTLTGHDGWVSWLAVHPSEPVLFSADTWGKLAAWSAADPTVAPRWTVPNAHDGWVRQIAISPDGQSLASCGLDRRIRIWSTADGKPVRDLPVQSDDVFSLAFHPDGKSLVSGDLRGIVKQWNVADGQATREFHAKDFYKLSYIQEVGGVRSLAFSPDGRTLAVSGAIPDSGGFVQATPMIHFFRWEDGGEQQALKLGEVADGFVHDLACHAEGFWVGVTSGQPGKGKYFFHRVGEAQPAFVGTKQMANCHSLTLHPNGRRFAVISNEGTYGQKRSMAREGIYPGNTSPIHVFDFAEA